MAQVLAIPPGRLKPGDRKKLAAADIVVVELDDPSELRIIQVECADLAPSELAWAAVAALDDSGFDSVRHAFVKNVRGLVTRNLQRRSQTEKQEQQR